MKISILGYGPIPEKLAHELSKEEKVELFTSQKVSNLGVPVHDYDSFLETELDFDVLILAWRGLPKNGTEKADVLRYLVKNSPTRSLIINLSSVAVYGQNSSVNTEETEPHPINDYGYSKFFLERYLNIFATSTVCNLRISNVFGHPNFDDVLNRMLHAARSEIAIDIVSKNEVKRDFISINTLVENLQSLLFVFHKINHRETLNVSSGFSLALTDLIRIVETCSDKRVPFLEQKGSTDLILNSMISNKKLRSILKNHEKSEMAEITSYLQEIISKSNIDLIPRTN